MKRNKSLQLSVVLLVVTALVLISSTGCQITIGAPPSPQPGQPGPVEPRPGQPGPGEPGPGQPGPAEPRPGEPGPGQPPGGAPGEAQITFTANRTSLNSGECANLQWSTQGGFAVTLNGQPVNASGQQQACPQQTTTYSLGVDMGSSMKQQQIVITVGTSGGGANNPPPSSQPPPVAPPPSGSGCPGAPQFSTFTANKTSAIAGESVTLSWGAVTNGNSTVLVQSVVLSGVGEVGSPGSRTVTAAGLGKTTYTLTATGCGGTASKTVTIDVFLGAKIMPTPTMPLLQVLTFDLAMDDIYPHSSGKIMARLKNAGTGSLNASIQLTCSSTETYTQGNTQTTKNGGPATKSVSINLTAGQTTDVETGFARNPSITSMWVSCSMTMSFLDSNTGNNSNSKQVK